ncbi:MAG: 4'-phosphopantetheinyl transferase [Candidatus Brocadiaceae bacterium]|nr:4'-phosphopantetheinyl transferase [Candidatus Brocadiaceae bacterium]
MIEIWYTHFHEPFTDETWNACLQKMPEALQTQTLRFVRWQDRLANLLGKTLLRECLMKHGYSPDCLKKITYTEYNRPFIDGAMDFNISHSGNYVVCAINTAGRIGVDVERMKPLKIEEFKDCMTSEEWRTIQDAPSRLEKFYELWTLKESVIKGDGRGLSLPLPDVRVEGEIVRVGNACWYAKKINLDSHYSCHTAANHEISSLQLHKYSDC